MLLNGVFITLNDFEYILQKLPKAFCLLVQTSLTWWEIKEMPLTLYIIFFCRNIHSFREKSYSMKDNTLVL